MRSSFRIMMALLGVGIMAPLASSAGLENFTIKGKSYFEYVQPLSDEGPGTTEAFSEFRFTRAYLTIQHNIDDRFAVRYRTDVDRKADDKLRPFVKHAYLSWAGLVQGGKFYIGISETPTFALEQNLWGYRSVSKTLMDGFKSSGGKDLGVSSAMTGVALKGRVSEGKLGYHLMLSNGAGYGKSESNNEKRVLAQVAAKPGGGLVLAGGFEAESGDEGDGAETLMSALAGYQNEALTVAGSYFTQTDAGAEVSASGISVFGRYDLGAKWTTFGRYDLNEPNSDAEDDESTLLILGLDYRPMKTVHVMPNLRVQSYAADGIESDTWAALTFQYQF